MLRGRWASPILVKLNKKHSLFFSFPWFCWLIIILPLHFPSWYPPWQVDYLWTETKKIKFQHFMKTFFSLKLTATTMQWLTLLKVSVNRAERFQYSNRYLLKGSSNFKTHRTLLLSPVIEETTLSFSLTSGMLLFFRLHLLFTLFYNNLICTSNF